MLLAILQYNINIKCIGSDVFYEDFNGCGGINVIMPDKKLLSFCMVLIKLILADSSRSTQIIMFKYLAVYRMRKIGLNYGFRFVKKSFYMNFIFICLCRLKCICVTIDMVFYLKINDYCRNSYRSNRYDYKIHLFALSICTYGPKYSVI